MHGDLDACMHNPGTQTIVVQARGWGEGRRGLEEVNRGKGDFCNTSNGKHLKKQETLRSFQGKNAQARTH